MSVLILELLYIVAGGIYVLALILSIVAKRSLLKSKKFYIVVGASLLLLVFFYPKHSGYYDRMGPDNKCQCFGIEYKGIGIEGGTLFRCMGIQYSCKGIEYDFKNESLLK